MKDFYLSSINEELSQNQIIKTGTFTDMYGRETTITKNDLLQMKDNFYNNVMNMKRKGVVNVPINYAHNRDKKAAGWIHGVDVIDNENGESVLIAQTEWVGEGKDAVQQGEYSFISAEIEFGYIDNKTKKNVGAVLKGAGLTNIPAVEGLNALMSKGEEDSLRAGLLKFIQEEQTKEKKMDFDALLKAISELPEDQKAQLWEKLGYKPTMPEIEATKKVEEMTAAAAQMENKCAELSKQIEELTKTSKEKDFDILLSKGQAVEAQREAFLSGNVVEFAKNMKALNLSATGTSSDSKNESPKTREEAEDKMISLATALSEKEQISFSQALKKVKAENLEMYKLSKGE